MAANRSIQDHVIPTQAPTVSSSDGPPPHAEPATDLLPLIVEIRDLVDVRHRPVAGAEPAFDPMAFGPGEEPTPLAPLSWLERMVREPLGVALGFVCGATVMALAMLALA